MTENQGKILLEYFLKKEGAWEEWNKELENPVHDKWNHYAINERFITNRLLWCETSSGNAFWESLHRKFINFYNQSIPIKNTKLAKKIYQDKIIIEDEEYLIVSQSRSLTMELLLSSSLTNLLNVKFHYIFLHYSLTFVNN